VHVSIYGHGSIAMNIHHVDMVLYIDTSTLLTYKPGVGKSTRSLCDIHAGFCSCLLLSVCLFPFLFIYRIYDTFTCVDSLIYAHIAYRGSEKKRVVILLADNAIFS